MLYYVVVDIGCLECGESSAVLGAFSDPVQAEAVRNEARQAQQADWTGQHYFKVFPLELERSYFTPVAKTPPETPNECQQGIDNSVQKD